MFGATGGSSLATTAAMLVFLLSAASTMWACRAFVMSSTADSRGSRRSIGAATEIRAVTTYQLFIDGQFTASSTSEQIEVENPSTQQLLSLVPKGTVEDAKSALDAAKAAQPGWEAMPAASRGACLLKLADLIKERREELAITLAYEQAKTLGLAQVEIDASCAYLEYYNGWSRLYEGEIIPSDRPGEQIYLHRCALGVSVGICPWNFPIFVMMRKIAPALVTGNSVVVKVSEYTPNTAFEICKLFEEAGIPRGVVNVVVGYGNEIGNALVDSDIPGIISMTGSVAAGTQIMRTAAPHLTKLNLELGGKAPVLVMKDANVDKTVADIWGSRSLYTGQICNSPERIYVHSSIEQEFTEKLVKAAEQTKVGLPDADGIDMCGLCNPDQLTKVAGMVDRAVKEGGAEVLTGGDVSDQFDTGYHYKPTVLTNVKQSDEIMQKEIFGPVLPVMPFVDFDEALALANDCEYGLTSSVFTNDASVVHRAMTGLKFGETYINRDHFEAIQGFHAGWRKSGIGGTDGKHGLYEYLGTRTVYWNTHQ